MPVRRRFDVRAFGVNAYTADEAGQDVVEEHTEETLGHEELYVVVAGRARFVLDGEEHVVPAGSVVHLTDPSVRRHAVAEEPGTTVLALGGKPGAAYEISAWEFWFAASAAAETGGPKAALEELRPGLELYPEHPMLFYQLACWEALDGRRDEALEHIRRAVELGGERFREWAGEDEDLDSIRDDPEFPT